jgi:alkanesulfonate monooxygenase SsuD/methylene tetrahydromethanopterin reductase-like flavin-dependent oxidoreductase (luciferase family)
LFPPVPERQRTLEEAVHILRGLWIGAPFGYAGQHFRINNARFPAPPGQQPV